MNITSTTETTITTTTIPTTTTTTITTTTTTTSVNLHFETHHHFTCYLPWNGMMKKKVNLPIDYLWISLIICLLNHNHISGCCI